MPNTHESHHALCLRMLQIVNDHRREHGFPPTLHEVGQKLGITSKSHLSYIRNTLASRGLLTFHPYMQRTLVLTINGHAAIAARAMPARELKEA